MSGNYEANHRHHAGGRDEYHSGSHYHHHHQPSDSHHHNSHQQPATINQPPPTINQPPPPPINQPLIVAPQPESVPLLPSSTVKYAKTPERSYVNMAFGVCLAIGIIAIGASFIFLQVQGGGMLNMGTDITSLVVFVLGVILSVCICVIWTSYSCYWKKKKDDDNDDNDEPSNADSDV